MSPREAAAEFGIDLALLDANLARTPAERLAELAAMIRLVEAMQDRTLSAEQRARLRRREMAAELLAYGFEEELARYDAMTPPEAP
jgi:hypothetical protein